MKVLKRAQFGDPILRKTAKKLSVDEIKSVRIQKLIEDMRFTLLEKKLGIGLAAPQVGKSLALAVIAIRPTELRAKIKPFDLVLINPEITEYKGKTKEMWEGCISAGSKGTADLFAKVPRYEEVKVTYYDEKGTKHSKTFKDLKAQVIQHEVDHLGGILFVDLVKDTKTYMTYKEYLKVIPNELNP